MSLKLIIKKMGASGANLSVDVDPSSTVAELKEKIAPDVELAAENIRLVCAGRVWDNVATIASYSPGDGSVVHCLNNPTRAAAPAAAQTLTAANPMQQMMGSAMFPPANSSDPFEQMQAQVQQQMMQNPEMIQQMMNSPMMQQMMSNPETLRGMMRMNPRMNQLMEQRPEIARMLEDPEVIQQSMRMMSNPELMREMIRNQDRAMGQLDVMPGGHQALQRAHEEYVDPMYAAMQGSNGAGAAQVPTYDNDAAPNTEALANPWGGAPSAAPTAVAPPAPAALPVPPAPSTSPAPPPTGTPQPFANPMQQMMQQMMGNPAMMQMGNAPPVSPFGPPASPFGNNAQPGMGAQNPFNQMMQQMMSNPAMMQQAMAMTQQMMNPPNQAQAGDANASANAAAGGFNAPPSPFGQPGMGAPNPMQQMMQQMMNAGQQGAGQQGAGQQGAGQQGAGDAAVPESVQKARFASQLVQLANMGFSDESMCLRALAQHNGRLDSAIDVLLAGGVE